MTTRKKLQARVAMLSAQLAVHTHETRKALNARVLRLAGEVKDLTQQKADLLETAMRQQELNQKLLQWQQELTDLSRTTQMQQTIERMQAEELAQPGTWDDVLTLIKQVQA